ncbi:MAG: hypothetical protein C0482_05495 [Gordonia sp.]|jgi:hypothetical protein|uniref:DUF3263 domain-containing protein n=1 Tax=Gordonia rubripertincta TaxID=36822 RepID=A0ABT4MSE9_GORRU|nr:DUF3263 domain-containing protein [Gordonia rubripertincta]MBA4021798.1 hypothetical protein [Gordonia sp. (in: high G+C Gram-positive bacteria)]MCZ4549928.1 DUF3263 domain-containing protein [Gordonia rubripertincta]
MDTHAGSKLDEMVDFEAKWYRLGGGPSDEIHDRFGMSDRTFFTELNDLMSDGAQFGEIAPEELAVMRAVIRRRLWLAR